LKPEDGKLYESRNVRFNEKLVYGDKYGKTSVKDWLMDFEEINKEKWFIETEKETQTSEEKVLETEGEQKRKRGRPKKKETTEITTAN